MEKFHLLINKLLFAFGVWVQFLTGLPFEQPKVVVVKVIQEELPFRRKLKTARIEKSARFRKRKK